MQIYLLTLILYADISSDSYTTLYIYICRVHTSSDICLWHLLTDTYGDTQLDELLENIDLLALRYASVDRSFLIFSRSPGMYNRSLSMLTHILLPYCRSLWPYRRSLLPYRRSILPYCRSLLSSTTDAYLPHPQHAQRQQIHQGKHSQLFCQNLEQF